jgi:hypothetical protein
VKRQAAGLAQFSTFFKNQELDTEKVKSILSNPTFNDFPDTVASAAPSLKIAFVDDVIQISVNEPEVVYQPPSTTIECFNDAYIKIRAAHFGISDSNTCPYTLGNNYKSGRCVETEMSTSLLKKM